MSLSTFMSLLDEHKQTMPENTYLTMANALKRKFDEDGGGEQIFEFTVFEIKDVSIETSIDSDEEELPDDCDFDTFQWDHAGRRTVRGKQTMNQPYKVKMTLKTFFNEYKLETMNHCLSYSNPQRWTFDLFEHRLGLYGNHSPTFPLHLARKHEKTPIHHHKTIVTTINQYLYSVQLVP